MRDQRDQRDQPVHLALRSAQDDWKTSLLAQVGAPCRESRERAGEPRDWINGCYALCLCDSTPCITRNAKQHASLTQRSPSFESLILDRTMLGCRARLAVCLRGRATKYEREANMKTGGVGGLALAAILVANAGHASAWSPRERHVLQQLGYTARQIQDMNRAQARQIINGSVRTPGPLPSPQHTSPSMSSPAAPARRDSADVLPKELGGYRAETQDMIRQLRLRPDTRLYRVLRSDKAMGALRNDTISPHDHGTATGLTTVGDDRTYSAHEVGRGLNVTIGSATRVYRGHKDAGYILFGDLPKEGLTIYWDTRARANDEPGVTALYVAFKGRVPFHMMDE